MSEPTGSDQDRSGGDHVEHISWERPVDPRPSPEENALPESGLSFRPLRFADYPGQDKVRENLQVYVGACRKGSYPLDHVLLHGPPGLGKTTLARIVAGEMGAPFYQTSGPSIDKPGDVAGLMAGMESGAVLFIDEIHRLSIAVEEVLYTAMEDFCLDILVGQGPTARTVRMPLQPFTLIGATTRMSLLSGPLVSRFGIQERLEFYTVEALEKVLMQSASHWSITLKREGATELARRSRGSPRIANRLLRRVRDFAAFEEQDGLDAAIVDRTLQRLGIDAQGLDRMDRRILGVIRDRYSGGPVGLDTLAASVGEEKSTIEDVYEPYLLHHGFLDRGPKGRSLSVRAMEHLSGGAAPPAAGKEPEPLW